MNVCHVKNKLSIILQYFSLHFQVVVNLAFLIIAILSRNIESSKQKLCFKFSTLTRIFAFN